MAANEGYALDWNAEISKDSADFPLFPDGDYDFTVTKLEHLRYNGGAKIGPCDKASLTLEITNLDGEKTIVSHNLFLHSTVEYLLCAFFVSIGERSRGEQKSMNWNIVVGATGRCQIGRRTYKNKNGTEVTINEVKKFYDKEVVQPQGQSVYEPGRF